MKKLRIVGLFILMVVGTGSYAQDIGNLIQGSKNDINYLVGGYATPFIKAFGSGLNQGWYNTGAPHKFPGADITFSVSLIGVPKSDQTYLVEDNKLEQIQLEDQNGPIASAKVPTMIGSNKDSQYLYRLPDNSTFNAPSGIFPIAKVPVPIANLGIGLPKGTDLKFRYIPNVKLPFGDNLKIGMFGVGVMHDIKQWIPGVKNLPFSLSAFVGYTKFKTTVVMDASQNQSSEFDISATTIQAIISKKIAVLTVYGGFGYDISSGGLKVLGSYDVDGAGIAPPITDPVDFTASNSSPRATVGARLKLGPITFHGDYTARKYNAITAGFGISVR
jgi:hypothetical protein